MGWWRGGRRRHAAAPRWRRSREANAPRLLIQQDRGDDPGRDRDQHIVASDLDPVVAARRRAQVMAAPIVDDVLADGGVPPHGPPPRGGWGGGRGPPAAPDGP